MIAWGLTEDAEIEDLIEKVNVYCFKSELAPGKFIEMIYNVVHLANQFKTSVDKLPSKISKEQKKLEYFQQKVKQIRKITEDELSKHQVTLNDLADYKDNKPRLINENKTLKIENEIVKRDASALRERTENSLWNSEYRYDEMISEYQLEKLDQKWHPYERQMSVTELHGIAHQIYHNPSKYIDIIREIREDKADCIEM